ncbi:MAG: LysR family transcriptional regulator [Zoogloeaceae bacterium]|nr:LysR family transcriptional regulator [Rhodocyclaceae bacterium]MCP5235892.1 LysR family transcriptional regulator [Zoogloeaceae bacterium]
MRFSLRQIEVFVAIARAENVSRAAESLAMSQSAASSALSELERQFDRPLFDRVGKSVLLNESGRLLLPRAVELLDRAGELESLLRGRTVFGAIRLGATLTIGNYLATLIVAAYLRSHPECRARLEVHNTARIVEQLQRFELDLGLIEGQCHAPELSVERWIADELVVFCAPSHPLAGRTGIPVEALSREVWILRERGSGTRETFDHAMRHVDGPLSVRLELEHTEAIKRAVESGLGIGCISRLALRDAFRRGTLAPIEVSDIDLSRHFQFVWHRDKYQSEATRAFLGLCRRFTAGVARSDLIPGSDEPSAGGNQPRARDSDDRLR